MTRHCWRLRGAGNVSEVDVTRCLAHPRRVSAKGHVLYLKATHYHITARYLYQCVDYLKFLGDITCCTRELFEPLRLRASNKSITLTVPMRMCVSKSIGRREMVSALFRTETPSRSILRLPGGHVGTAILPGVEKGRAACVRRHATLVERTTQVSSPFTATSALQHCSSDHFYSIRMCVLL